MASHLSGLIFEPIYTCLIVNVEKFENSKTFRWFIFLGYAKACAKFCEIMRCNFTLVFWGASRRILSLRAMRWWCKTIRWCRRKGGEQVADMIWIFYLVVLFDNDYTCHIISGSVQRVEQSSKYNHSYFAITANWIRFNRYVRLRIFNHFDPFPP